MSTVDEALLAVAEEQLRWTRAASLPAVRKTIDTALGKTEQRRAFELCNGSRTATEIGAAVGVTQQSVSNWTKSWRRLGIAVDVDGHVRHLVSLEALGLPLEVE